MRKELSARLATVLTVVATMSLLSACVSFGAKPPPFLLSLTSDAQVSAGNQTVAEKSTALVIRLPDAPKKLQTLRVPVSSDGVTIAYLKEAFWVDRPTKLFQDLLSETVSANGDRLVLTSAQSGGQATTYLSGELVNFGLDGPALEVVVTYDAVELRDGQPVRKRRFEAREYVPAAEAEPVGRALNIAANKVATEVAAWVS